MGLFRLESFIMIRRQYLAIACGLLLFPHIGYAATDQFFDSGGVKIRYMVEGQGEPVLLIHGFTADIASQWSLPGINRALAKEFKVIALDNRGHGKSDKPHDPKKYGAEMVEDSIRLLDHLRIEKAHIVGYSMGGMITLKMEATHPERMLSATLGGMGWSQSADFRFREELADSLEQGKGIAPLLYRLTPAGRPRPSEEQIRFINQLITARNDVKALAAAARGMPGLFITEEELRAIKIPTLALIGAVDPLKLGVDNMHGKLPGLKTIVISKADHMNAFARSEFIDNLKEFLAKNSRSGKAEKRKPVLN